MPPYSPGSNFRPTSGYGPRAAPVPGASTDHIGQGFSAPTGTPIPAAAGGTVYFSGSIPGYGNTVVIKHNINGEKVYTLYAHLNERSSLRRGDKVNQGDSVGNVGNTGTGTGPHLHFEVIKDQPYPLNKGHETYNPSRFDFPNDGAGGGPSGEGSGGRGLVRASSCAAMDVAGDMTSRICEIIGRDSGNQVARKLTRQGVSVSSQAVYKWLKGGSVSDENLKALARAYQVSAAWLKFGEEAVPWQPLVEVLNGLSVEDRQQVLDFIEYKINKPSAALDAGRITQYMRMLDRVRQAMAYKKAGRS